MHVFSQPYKCPKCGYECAAGGSDMEYWKFSPITSEKNPICPKCWNEFLKTLGAEMRCTVNWTGKGSDYEQQYGQKDC